MKTDQSGFTKQGEQLINNIKQKIDPGDQNMLERMVIAGMKFMFSDQTHKYLLDLLNKPGTVAEKLGVGAVQLLAILMGVSKGNIPGQLIIPAGAILIIKAAEFMAKSGQQVTIQDVIQAIKLMTAGIQHEFAKSQGQSLTAGQQSTPPSAQPQPAGNGLIQQGG